MKSFFRSKGLLILAIFTFLLSACLSDLEKPTGLEDRNNQEMASSTELENNLENQEEDPLENNEENNLVNDDSTNIHENNNDDLVSEDSTNDHEDNSSDEKVEIARVDQSDEGAMVETSEGKNQAKRNPKKSSSTKSKGKNDKNNGSKTSPPPKGKDQSKPKKEKPNQKKPENPPKEEEPKKESKPTITHSIVIAAEGSYGQKLCQEKKYPSCPEDGRAEVPLPPTKMEIENGITVLEALIQITMEHNIHMDYRGGKGATAYIQGMGNVYEFDRGQGSGWMYRINGIFPDRGAGVVPLCDGDVIEWLYTTNLGRDLEADLKPFRRDGKCP